MICTSAGTGKSLAEGGPASLIIAYALVGFIVYVTLLLLGEMATQYPVAGILNTARGSYIFTPVGRFFQRLFSPLLFPVVCLCYILELLHQRCRIGGWRFDCRTTRPPILDDVRVHMGGQPRILDLSCWHQCYKRQVIRRAR